MNLISSAGLSPARSVLSNGAVVTAKRATTTAAVTINLAVKAGSLCDPADAPGAMHLLSRVVDRGTEHRSGEEIAEELDSRGISLSMSVTRHLFSIVCTCLAEDFAPVLALIGDIVMAPSVPEPELTTRKGEVVTAIRQDEDNPGARATEALMAMLYPGGHPYGRPLKGTVESVEALTRDRLLGLHAGRFAPGELSLVVVGDVDSSRVGDTAEQVFGAWRHGSPPPIPLSAVAPPARRQRRVIPMMNKAQADIAYGFTAIARKDPAFETFRLLNNVFGQYAIGGRLGDSIRERQGMAYYVFSALDANVVPGPLTIRAGVGPANVDRTIASIDEEIVRLRRDGVTDKELNESRQYLIGSMPRTLETNAGIAQFLQTVEFFQLGLDYDVRLPALLSGITRESVRDAALAVLDPDRASVVIAGPYQDS